MTEPTGERPSGAGLARRGAELLALWGLAGVQPILDLFGRNPEFFLAAHTGPGEIVAFALVVTFAVPLVLFALEVLVGLVRPAWAQVLHTAFVALLGAALGGNIARQLGVEATIVVLALAAAVAVGIVVARRTSATVRSVLAYLALAPIAFLALFLLGDAGQLVFADDAVALDLPIQPDGPVVVVVLDELPLASLLTPEGTIDADRYPGLARLAASSTWYRDATSVAPSTPESVPTVFTGRFPSPDRLPTSADNPINLFTILGGSYRVDALESVTDLCPDSICRPAAASGDVGDFAGDLWGALGDAEVVYGHLTLPAALSDHLPSLDEAWAGFAGASTGGGAVPASDIDAVGRQTPSDFLRGRQSAARRRGVVGEDLQRAVEGYDGAAGTLFVGHDAFLPHQPWHHAPTGGRYDLSPGGVAMAEGRWPTDELAVRRAYQRHLLQVGYASTVVGELIDDLQAAGTWDDATVVVTADHGISFEAGGHAREPTDENVQEIYRVPLFVKAPGQTEGAVSDENALLPDILPTVLDLLDIDPPAGNEFDGQSLLDPAAHRQDKPVGFDGGPQAVPGDFGTLLPIVARHNDWLGPRTGWAGVYQVGDAKLLVEREVDTLRVGAPELRGWSLDQLDQLEHIGPRAYLPLAVRGELSERAGHDLPSEVLIALDGRIVGLGPVGEDGVFRALLDHRFLTPGAHDVALYQANGPDSVRLLVAG